jgi:GNAT superfamily N-acetyltransferase
MTELVVGVERWSDRAAWDRFVATSPQGSVFCRADFLDALGVEWEAVRVGSDDRPQVAAVLLRDGAGPVRAPFPFTQYQGVLLPSAGPADPAHRRVRSTLDAVGGLLEGLRDRAELSWCLHPTFPDLRPFSWFNYHQPDEGRFAVEVRYAGIIPVPEAGTIDAVLGQSRSVRRQEWRKAGERFTVTASVDLELLDRLHADTFARQGIERPGSEARLLSAIAAAAVRSGFGEMFVAHDRDGRPAGAVLFLFDERAAYYLVAAHDPAFRSTGVSTLLFLAGVERGLRRGVRQIDVVGMNSPGRADFKASFGAVPIPYFVVRWRHP